jgi:hypothetical protein
MIIEPDQPIHPRSAIIAYRSFFPDKLKPITLKKPYQFGELHSLIIS